MAAIFKTECIGCNKKFKTTKKKSVGEKYECPHCGYKHIADYDECEETWFPASKPKQLSDIFTEAV
jgi:predicted RNA-binding Zn-ribbon protein involved in translation (DUF1610 family)